VSSTTRHRPILEPSELRRLPIGTGLLLLRSAPPIMMRLQPWTARPDATGLTAGRQAWERRMLAGALRADVIPGKVTRGA
jgi:type IV secretory pathway TraG/TraD family ATPase VirD4